MSDFAWEEKLSLAVGATILVLVVGMLVLQCLFHIIPNVRILDDICCAPDEGDAGMIIQEAPGEYWIIEDSNNHQTYPNSL